MVGVCMQKKLNKYKIITLWETSHYYTLSVKILSKVNSEPPQGSNYGEIFEIGLLSQELERLLNVFLY
ncbi:hypothetical protein ANRL1_02920 [Anaerolineae bacterium]|nr:hypothetical protein ANRL1_02920 [Anaerolineae bacterium]